MTVKPPEETLFENTSVEPRPYNRLVPAVMRHKDCTSSVAKEYVREHGRVDVELELRAAGFTNGRWP